MKCALNEDRSNTTQSNPIPIYSVPHTKLHFRGYQIDFDFQIFQRFVAAGI